MNSVSTTSNLLELLDSTAAAQRMNTVDRALSGSGIGQKNFKGTWLGYSLNNKPTVRVNGKTYNVDNVAMRGLEEGGTALVRVGKGVIVSAWR